MQAIIPNQNGILTPGLPILPTGVERYPIKEGSLFVQLYSGDKITIIDSEGMQPVELLAFAKNGNHVGQINSEILNIPSNGNAVATRAILDSSEPSAVTLKKKLQEKNIILDNLKASLLFEHGSVPGESQNLVVNEDAYLLICVHTTQMLPWEQNTSTDIVVLIERENIEQLVAQQSREQNILANPLIDINIQPGQAKEYIVKKGDFFQIMDIHGRECSDFQAFSLADLDKGLEREIDPTTTRSLLGSLYPTPGIFAKYFNCNQEALVEIVQDTCGRHDTFNLACTAKYYEDLGYPGHLNCSDNINKSLAKYNINSRQGWSAINFFFNTMLDDTNAIVMDDPWSRPGDYVLLRALTDILCVSTACPCDVDPANGWNPTDIQVRTYSGSNQFNTFKGWRKNPMDDLNKTKETAFHSCFAKYTRDFVEYNGYWLPNKFNNLGAIEEYWACREKAVVMDLTPLRKYEVIGPDAEKLMQLCVTRNMKKLSIGSVVYTAMCYEHGGMIDDGTVFRLDDTNFRWVGGNDDSGQWLQKQAQAHKLNVWVRNSTEQLANIAVQGRLSKQILSEVFWTPPIQPTINELEWFKFTIARVGDYLGVACVVSRTGYTGELGYEIFCHPKDAEVVFAAVEKVGNPLGMKPLGFLALDMLRIESGLVFGGAEFTDQTDPFEAGIGFTTPLKTNADDFIGRTAIEKRKENPQKKLVGLEMDSDLVPVAGSCVRVGKAQVGEITSATKSPLLGKVIALARVDVTHATIGSTINVGQLDGEQKILTATITPFPHFDPTKERAKGNY